MCTRRHFFLLGTYRLKLWKVFSASPLRTVQSIRYCLPGAVPSCLEQQGVGVRAERGWQQKVVTARELVQLHKARGLWWPQRPGAQLYSLSGSAPASLLAKFQAGRIVKYTTISLVSNRKSRAFRVLALNGNSTAPMEILWKLVGALCVLVIPMIATPATRSDQGGCTYNARNSLSIWKDSSDYPRRYPCGWKTQL